ncbi:uncharacterized protein LOC110098679 [Dendrobium catenatum]|uniref:uncharacterized protein LOC110098679 n=1 Tax=Dendrobium catenatum TaxID=906689 RepID=UPI0009F47B14|nr:uncharacterized protein LOC110098679 [Dendrobium catenatum]
MDWVLCSFHEKEPLEAIFANGSWFVRGQIIGVHRWSLNFSLTSLKGLTSPVWIRMPNLPLQCWDELNVCRIASLVGKPLLIDGNKFQWGRQEIGRVCVRIKLDEQLPLRVWVEGSTGKFLQKIEYERIPNFYFECGKIGHLKKDCLNSKINSSPAEDLVKNKSVELNTKANFKEVGEEVPLAQADPDLSDGHYELSKSSEIQGADPKVQLEVLIKEQESKSKSGMEPITRSSAVTENKFDVLNSLLEEGEIIIPDEVNEHSVVEKEDLAVSIVKRDKDTSKEESGDIVEATSKKKGTKQLKGSGPINLAPRSRRLDGDISNNVINCILEL